MTQLALLHLFNYEDLKAAILLNAAFSVDTAFIPALVAMGETLLRTGHLK